MSHSHSSYLSPDVYFLWRFLEGRTVMVVSHGNTLRAMVKRLDAVSDEDIFHVDLPTAVPIIYDLEACEGGGLEGGGLSVVSEPKGFWGDSKAVRNGRFLMEEKQVRAAQQAMRDQALRDVQVSPYDTEEVVKPVKFADAVSSDVIAVGDKGETYNVRERPPSYFAQESERIASEAELEYANFQVVRRTGRVSGRKKEVKAALTLLRHGYSEWNRANLFTGWKDVDLTIRGREEARRAGRVLKAAGAKRVERVYTSVLSRAVKTAWLMLDEMELQVKRGGGWGVGGGRASHCRGGRASHCPTLLFIGHKPRFFAYLPTRSFSFLPFFRCLKRQIFPRVRAHAYHSPCSPQGPCLPHLSHSALIPDMSPSHLSTPFPFPFVTVGATLLLMAAQRAPLRRVARAQQDRLRLGVWSPPGAALAAGYPRPPRRMGAPGRKRCHRPQIRRGPLSCG